MRIGLLHSRIRVEERLLADELAALAGEGVEHELIDVRSLVFDIHDRAPWQKYDLVLDRCISQTQGLAAVRCLEALGVRCVNSGRVIEVCGDKMLTSLLLARNGVPTPRTLVALEPESALEAVERMGYPAVLKPATGSWGRLLARVNDRDAAEAIIEHKSTLGSVQHGIFYIQEYVRKPERDLRVFTIGDEAICGIVRNSAHWITNTARGGQASVLEITDELRDICARASRSVGGGILAIDLLECPERGLLVSEINHTMEFRNSIAPTGVNIPGRMARYLVSTWHGSLEPCSTPTAHGSGEPCHLAEPKTSATVRSEFDVRSAMGAA